MLNLRLQLNLYSFLDIFIFKFPWSSWPHGHKESVRHRILGYQIFFPMCMVYSMCAKQQYFLEKNLQIMGLGIHIHLILIESIPSGPSSMQ